MKTLETGDEKLQKICDALRKETLEPAKEDAKRIKEEAGKRADEIIADAEKRAKELIVEARKEIEREENVFHSTMEQAAKQCLEMLRQTIEKSFFNQELKDEIKNATSDRKVIAGLIEVIIEAIEKQGLSTDIDVIVAREVSSDEINNLLTEKLLKRLKDGSVSVGDFDGGVKVSLRDKKMTLEVTDEALMDILTRYVSREDFRKRLFA